MMQKNPTEKPQWKWLMEVEELNDDYLLAIGDAVAFDRGKDKFEFNKRGNLGVIETAKYKSSHWIFQELSKEEAAMIFLKL